MRRIFIALIFLALLLGSSTSPVAAQDGRDPEFEQGIYDRLERINPAAVPVFIAATEALDRDDLAAAQAGFEQVLRLAPDFPDALRRLSQVSFLQEDLDKAEVQARKALEVDDSPENKSNLAYILLNLNSTDTNFEAFRLAQAAVAEQPDDSYNLLVLSNAAIATENGEVLSQTTEQWVQLEPEEPLAHYFKGIAAAVNEKWEIAESELLLAQKLGLPADFIRETLDQGISTQARMQRALRWTLYGLAGWVVSLALLFLIGLALSQATLGSLKRQQSQTAFEIRPAERLVRQIYRVVIALTSLYYYISIPVLLLLVIALVGGTIYAFFAIGQIPIKLALIILGGGGFTLLAVIRSLFIKRKQEDPGTPLERKDSLFLQETLDEVARKVQTRPVQKVFITPGTEIGVYERGKWWQRLRGQGERCLILGLGALPGLNQGQFRAILAHEYGHFSNADTAGGDLAHTVSFNIHNMAQGLFEVGTAAWYNPVWLFINGYYRIFLLITRGASRLQEVLADRLATFHYGLSNMESGLKHTIHQDLLFQSLATREINQAIEENRGLQNLYTLPEGDIDSDLEAAYQKIMEAKTSPYASHPSPQERLEYITKVPNSAFNQEDHRPAWDLFPDAVGLQKEITELVEGKVRRTGV